MFTWTAILGVLKRGFSLLTSPYAWIGIFVATTLLCFGLWRHQVSEVEQAKAECRETIKVAEEVAVKQALAQRAERERKSLEEAQRYEDQKKDLAAIRKSVPNRSVRVRVGPPGVQPASPPASVNDGPAADKPDVSGEVGRDIGPDLYGLADECDDNARRLEALQGWSEAQASQ